VATSSSGENFGLDFTADPSTATWTGSGGVLPSFPISVGNTAGYATKQTSILMENSITYTQPSLLTVPQLLTKDGYIQAVYPAYVVQSGDHFKATIGCKDSATSCDVYFRLDYKKVSDGTVSTFWTFHEVYDGYIFPANVDLSSLVGQNLQFILTVVANNATATAGQAVWIAPRIVH
jgi:hypothetical protein